MRVALFITCLTDVYFPRAGVAVVKVLTHLGHTVEFPRDQTCCGQPMFNNGFTSDARDLARRMIALFEPFETVVTPSASCAAMVRERYPQLFAGDAAWSARADALAARTFEFSEFLAKVLRVNLRQLGVRWDGNVAVHSACHLRSLGLHDVAEGLLREIRGLKQIPLNNVEQCCGFGGTFATRYPQISGAMVREKVECIQTTGCPTVVCNEAGCGMNLAGACRRLGSPVRFTSLPEIIAEGLGLLERPEEGR